MKHVSFYILFIAIQIGLRAQDHQPVDTSNGLEDVSWEKLLESAIEDQENFSILEDVSQYEDIPIDLNTAPIEELHRVPGITNVLASRIVARRRHALFSSTEELISLDGVASETLPFIRPYVKTRNKKENSIFTGSCFTRVSGEGVKRKGFMNGAYPGTPVKSLSKIFIAAGNQDSPLSSIISKIEIGALAEKDPGENNLTSFSSAFGSISIPPLSAKIILGHYQVEAAEGLVFWRGYAFSKGSDVISPTRKNGSGIHPYSSSEENNFLQGIAVSVELNCIKIQTMYSNKTVHASIDSFGRISSIDKSGLFRTENELRRKNSTREMLVGCRAVADLFDGFKIGGTTYQSRFANPLTLKNSRGETAEYLTMKGMDVSYTNTKVDVFAELAADWKNAIAFIGGMTYEPLSLFKLSLVARSYPSAFQSIHGNAFGETNGQVQNETGLYVGVQFHPMNELWISTYFDQFRHSQPDQSIPVPSHGNDFLAFVECQVTKNYGLSFRYKRKETPAVFEGNDFYGRALQEVNPRIQENYRLSSELISSPSVRLVNRVEWVSVDYGNIKCSEHGLLLSQAVKCTLFDLLTLRARIAVFETDSYDSRIYEYEDDLPRTFSNPPLYGRGVRWYLIFRYKLFLKVSISAKYSQTIKEGVTSIGTGLDEIEGNSQSLLSMQLDVRF